MNYLLKNTKKSFKKKVVRRNQEGIQRRLFVFFPLLKKEKRFLFFLSSISYPFFVHPSLFVFSLFKKKDKKKDKQSSLKKTSFF